MYILTEEQLLAAFKKMNHSHALVMPVFSQDKFYLKHFAAGTWEKNHWAYAPIRTPQPLKSFFYPPQQKVAEYPGKDDNSVKMNPTVIVGAKACDIAALAIIDKVYAEGEYPDPYYLNARRNNIIISADCLEAGDYCSCTLMNNRPYAESEFDINLSLDGKKYLLEIGSDKGQKFFETFFGETEKAQESDIKNRERKRTEIEKAVQKKNEKFQYYETHQQAIEKHLATDVWADLAKTCVECGTCTQICPTCHCFMLFDQSVEDRFERIKVWDSCFFAGYSRMAGGLTPRLSLADRFKNRFYHKFDSFVTNFGVEACTGCGRCSEGCMGSIDLREVLMELEKRVVLKEQPDLA